MRLDGHLIFTQNLLSLNASKFSVLLVSAFPQESKIITKIFPAPLPILYNKLLIFALVLQVTATDVVFK
jgi:hypothetical protein